MIIKSKNVFTGESDWPGPAAILIEGEKIGKILPYYVDEEDFPWEKVVDYGDCMVMPSFVDAHTHLFSGAVDNSDYVCDTLGLCRSQEECVEYVKEFVKHMPQTKRVRGTGWFVGAWNDAPLPDKRSLDAAFPDIPVYLRCADGHSMWLNTKAIEESGYTDDFDVENGEVCRFPDGTLTGLMIEPAALAPAMEKYMEFSEEELKIIHESFQRKLAEYGIAAVSEMFADDYIQEMENNYRFLKSMDEEKGLCAQVFCYTRLFGYTDFTPYFRFQKELESKHFHIAGVKGFIDGVTETYTGLLLEPYTDRPDSCGEGLPLWPKEKMQEEIIAANKAGIQVRLHCIADGSVRMALDMYEKARTVCGEQDIRNTVEHIENIHPSDMERFRELSVTASMQPYHLTLSNNGKVWRLGAERCKYEFPIRSIYETGAEIALGTDYPVVTINPFITIHAALTRCDDEGKPTGHNAGEQTLPLAVILKAYTMGGARVYHADDRIGSLCAGKDADLIVLDRNLFACTPEEIRETKVIANYFEGRKIV